MLIIENGGIYMTKIELINFMAEESGVSKADVTRVLDALMSGITKGLKEEGKVTITGFCTFARKERKESVGHNPRTGASVTIPAKSVVSIKAGTKLKDIFE